MLHQSRRRFMALLGGAAACEFDAAFTPELKGAWRALYGTVQAEMLRAGADKQGWAK